MSSFSIRFDQNVRFSNPLWLCNATNLRQIANEFSHSPLRNLVRMRAQSVDLLSLNSQNFSEMIQEVFSVSRWNHLCLRGLIVTRFTGRRCNAGTGLSRFLFLLRCRVVRPAKSRDPHLPPTDSVEHELHHRADVALGSRTRRLGQLIKST